MAAEHGLDSLSLERIVRPRDPELVDQGTGESECRDLLRTKHVGRVVCTLHGLPAVLPVNFACVDENIFLRVRPTTPLAIKLPGAIIALVVDDFEDPGRRGWLVVVTGLCVPDTGLPTPPPKVAALAFWAETAPPWLALDAESSLWRCTRTV